MRAYEQTVAVVGAPIGHVVALWAADLVACEIGRGEEFNLGDDNRLLAGCDCIRGGIIDLVGGDEEGVGWRVEDAGLMEVRRTGIIDQELKSWIRAEEGKERVVINEKRLRLGCLRGDDRLPGKFRSTL